MKPSSPPPPRYLESVVAETIGVPHETLRQRRRELLVERVGFIRDGRDIYITQEGLADLAAAFGLEKIALEKKEAAPPSAVTTAPLSEKPRSQPPSSPAPHPEVQTTEPQLVDSPPHDFESALAETLAVSIAHEAGRPIIHLIVTGKPRNSRLLFAKKKDPGPDHVPGTPAQQLRVRVRDNAKFTIHLKIQARLIHGDLYELVGRCPRFRGKF